MYRWIILGTVVLAIAVTHWHAETLADRRQTELIAAITKLNGSIADLSENVRQAGVTRGVVLRDAMAVPGLGKVTVLTNGIDVFVPVPGIGDVKFSAELSQRDVLKMADYLKDGMSETKNWIQRAWGNDTPKTSP